VHSLEVWEKASKPDYRSNSIREDQGFVSPLWPLSVRRRLRLLLAGTAGAVTAAELLLPRLGNGISPRNGHGSSKRSCLSKVAAEPSVPTCKHRQIHTCNLQGLRHPQKLVYVLWTLLHAPFTLPAGGTTACTCPASVSVQHLRFLVVVDSRGRVAPTGYRW